MPSDEGGVGSGLRMVWGCAPSTVLHTLDGNRVSCVHGFKARGPALQTKVLALHSKLVSWVAFAIVIAWVDRIRRRS